MHFCLSIPEILDFIFFQLSDSDLLSTALTCRRFKLVALQALWRDLPDLSPIVHCFPHDAWQKKTHHTDMDRPEKVTAISYVPIRDLLPQDWTTVLPYLPVIRSLGRDPLSYVSINLRPIIPEEFLAQMLASFPGHALFPNLRKLDSSAGFTNAALGVIHSSLGPQLQSLTMGYLSPIPAFQGTTFIVSISALCPNLRRLEINSALRDCFDIAYAICQLHHLEYIKAPNLTVSALIHVSQLRKLRQLTIWGTIPHLSHFPPVPRPAFPALKALFLLEVPLPFHANVHSIIASSNYERYEGRFRKSPKVNEWRDLIAQLTGMPQTPRHIVCQIDIPRLNINNPDYVITADILQPILSIGNLKTLDLSTFIHDIDDEFTLQLAQSCPLIEHVELGTRWCTERRSTATLLSFVNLSNHCRDLRYVGLAVDASVPDCVSSVDQAKGITKLVREGSVFSFSVGDSYIQDPLEVALFLSSLFDLERIEIPDDHKFSIRTAVECPGRIKRRWTKVAELIPVFVAARAQGALKAKGNRA